jgi:MATE family multidrug resistance protein
MRTIADLKTAIHRHWTLAWPLIIANIATPLLGLADAAIAGHLAAPNYLAAVTVGAELFAILFGTFLFLRMGTTGLVAQSEGRGDSQGGLQLLIHALMIATAIGLALVVFGHWLVEPLMQIIRPAAEMNAPLAEYLEIRLLGAPAALCLFAITGWLVGRGRTKVSLYVAVGINVVNIALNYGLAIGLEMNSAGIAWGTVIAEYLGLIYGFTWLLVLVDHRDVLTSIRFRTDQLWALVRVNGPLMLRTIALHAVFAGLSIAAARIGAIEASAVGIFLVLLATAAYALDGFAYASEIEAGQAIGQRNNRRFRDSLWAGALLTLITATCIAFGIAVFGSTIVSALTTHDAVITEATRRLDAFTLILLALCLSYWLDGVFIGLTRTVDMCLTMWLAASIGWFGMLAWYQNPTLDELFVAFFVFAVLRTGLLGARLPSAMRHINVYFSNHHPKGSEPV